MYIFVCISCIHRCLLPRLCYVQNTRTKLEVCFDFTIFTNSTSDQCYNFVWKFNYKVIKHCVGNLGFSPQKWLFWWSLWKRNTETKQTGNQINAETFLLKLTIYILIQCYRYVLFECIKSQCVWIKNEVAVIYVQWKEGRVKFKQVKSRPQGMGHFSQILKRGVKIEIRLSSGIKIFKIKKYRTLPVLLGLSNVDAAITSPCIDIRWVFQKTTNILYNSRISCNLLLQFHRC